MVEPVQGRSRGRPPDRGHRVSEQATRRGEADQVRLAAHEARCREQPVLRALSIPHEAADGKAKVTVSFADWKGVGVIPTTFRRDR